MYQPALSVRVWRIIKGRSVKQTFVTSPCSRKSILGFLVYEVKTSRNKLVKMLENKEMVALGKVQIRTSLKHKI